MDLFNSTPDGEFLTNSPMLAANKYLFNLFQNSTYKYICRSN